MQMLVLTVLSLIATVMVVWLLIRVLKPYFRMR